MVLHIAVLAKTSLFDPKKAYAKAAADSLLKTRVGCAGSPGSRLGAARSDDAGTQEEKATGSSPGKPPDSPVDLETFSAWNHVVCTLEPANFVEKKQRKDPKITRLKSVAGIGIGDINWRQLGTWCSSNGITGT
jgi:hypothetical protein